jgi:hypothetical protein
MNKRSWVIVEANASVKPAMEALMLGLTRHTKPVTPTTAAESKLKRTESQRFTTNDGESTDSQEQVWQIIPPHIQ